MPGKRASDYWQGWIDCIEYLQFKYCTGEIPQRARELMTNEKMRIKKILEDGKAEQPGSQVSERS